MPTPAEVASASRLQLHRLNLSILQNALAAHDAPAARAALSVLTDALDGRYELAQPLFDLYVYVNRLILAEAYDDASTIIQTLADGWAKIPDDGAPPIVAPSVLAGLTYTKDGLSELPDDAGREYHA